CTMAPHNQTIIPPRTCASRPSLKLCDTAYPLAAILRGVRHCLNDRGQKGLPGRGCNGSVGSLPTIESSISAIRHHEPPQWNLPAPSIPSHGRLTNVGFSKAGCVVIRSPSLPATG